MRERLVTLAGALIGLMVIYGLFMSEPEEGPAVSRPASHERGANGYGALNEWLVMGGVRTDSLRERFSTLADDARYPAATGNLLITTLPYYMPMREAESVELLGWVDSGNTLLVLAAVNDTPEWIDLAPSPWVDDLQTVSGLSITPIDEAADASSGDQENDTSSPLVLFDEPGTGHEYDILPVARHPLMDGVETMRAVSDSATWVWTAEVERYELLLGIATMEETATDMIWQRRFGDGHILVVGSGTMFTNRMIAEADNRVFVANIVDRMLADDGTVIFDDLHQGVSVLYDPEAFYADSRLHQTVYFVIGFWLLYIVGSSNRLYQPSSKSKVPRQSDFLDATGGFISRHLTPANAGLLMYRLWFNDVRRHMGLATNGEPVWRELDAPTLIDRRLLAKLQRMYSMLTNGRRVNLVDLHNSIRKARKAVG